MELQSIALKVSKASTVTQEQQQAAQHEKHKQDRIARMAYDQIKERIALENDPLLYDKVKWPLYKDLVFKRKNNNNVLPSFNKQVPRLVGMKQAPDLQRMNSSVTRSLATNPLNSEKGSSNNLHKGIDLKEIDRIAQEMTDQINKPVL